MKDEQNAELAASIVTDPRRARRPATARWLAVAAFGAVFVAGCGQDPKGSPTTSTAKPAAAKGSSKAGGATKKAGAYEELDSVPNAGKITGTVSYKGSEKDANVKVTKDDKACCPNCTGGERPAGSLVVTDGKLKNAVVYLDGITKGKKLGDTPVRIDNVGCVFEPHVAVGHKGGKLVAKNSDEVLHNTHLFLVKGDKDLLNIALPNKDKAITKKIKKTGVISIKCDVHEWMQGYIFSTTHPYAVVTGDDGSYSFEGVPPGEYTLKAWHERLGEKEMPVKVADGGAVTQEITYE